MKCRSWTGTNCQILSTRWARLRALCAFTALRAAETTVRPLAKADFVADLERRLERPIARRAPERKPAAGADGRLALL
jgi:hypothetical protein